MKAFPFAHSPQFAQSVHNGGWEKRRANAPESVPSRNTIRITSESTEERMRGHHCGIMGNQQEGRSETPKSTKPPESMTLSPVLSDLVQPRSTLCMLHLSLLHLRILLPPQNSLVQKFMGATLGIHRRNSRLSPLKISLVSCRAWHGGGY